MKFSFDTAVAVLRGAQELIALVERAAAARHVQHPDGTPATLAQVTASAGLLRADAQAGIAERQAALEAGKTKVD